MSTLIGIDLGTTNSVVAVFEGREARVLINEEGQRITPSAVALDAQGSWVVGSIARRQLVTASDRTATSVKRIIGRRFDEVEPFAASLPFRIAAQDNGDVAVVLDGRRVAPEFIAAQILGKLKRAAEAALGESVDGAVVTVPAYFDDAQRQATRRAGDIAGLPIRRIINEPTAAALSFGVQRAVGRQQRVVVFDMGGGTFDVSVLDVEPGVVEVRATAGDTRLGGDDMDVAIVAWLNEQITAQIGRDLAGDRAVQQRLRDAAERAKIELSTLPTTEVNLPFLVATDAGPFHLRAELSRARFEHLVEGLVDRAARCCEQALRDAGLAASDVDEVLLVGGATRVPLVEARVRALFGRVPNKTVNPDEAVAIGAAIQAGVLSGAGLDIVLVDVTPLSLGVETRGGLFTRVIERNTAIPTRAMRTFSTAVDDQAAIDVHVLQGERELARDNRTLGKFELSGIPPMPRATARIDVVFEIDANGIVSVSATERSSGVAARTTLTNAGGLTDDEVARLIAEAERAERADAERRALIERRNAVESSVLRLQRRLVEAAADVSPAITAGCRDVIGVAETALGAEILSEARYVELNSRVLAAATLLEDAALAASARRASAAAAAVATDDAPPPGDAPRGPGAEPASVDAR